MIKIDEQISLNPRRGKRVKVDETITLTRRKKKQPLAKNIRRTKAKNIRRTKAAPKAKGGRTKGEFSKKQLYAKAKEVKKSVGHKVAISGMTIPQLKNYINQHSGMVFS